MWKVNFAERRRPVQSFHIRHPGTPRVRTDCVRTAWWDCLVMLSAPGSYTDIKSHTSLRVPPTTPDPNRSRNLAVLNTADTPYDVICDGGTHMARDLRWRCDNRDLSASTHVGRVRITATVLTHTYLLTYLHNPRMRHTSFIKSHD